MLHVLNLRRSQTSVRVEERWIRMIGMIVSQPPNAATTDLIIGQFLFVFKVQNHIKSMSVGAESEKRERQKNVEVVSGVAHMATFRVTL